MNDTEQPILSRPAGFVEVLDRTRRVIHLKEVPAAGLALGRAYDNDLILDDPYVSPHHVKLTWENDRLRADDLGSINGMRCGDLKESVRSCYLEGGANLKIGRTMVRFRPVNFQVSEAMKDQFIDGPLNILNNSLCLISIYLLALLCLVSEAYLATADKFDAHPVVFGLMGVAAMVVIWSTVWSFASRIVAHRWNFFIHCAVASLGLICFSIMEASVSYFSFAVGADDVEKMIIIAGYILLTALVINLHLKLVVTATSLRQGLVAAGMALLLVGMGIGMNYWSESSFSMEPRYRVTLKAPAFKLAGSSTTADFFIEAAKLRGKVDLDVAKRRAKEQAKGGSQ